MTDKPITAKELEELFGKVDLEKLVRDEVLKESAEEIQRQYDKHLMTVLYGSSFADSVSYEENGDKYMVIPSENYEYLMKKPPKKIKRRIFYEVAWWCAESRYTKCFYSAKKMRKFVNSLHPWCDYDYIHIEKTWCYREHHPRHKTYYISFRPNHFIWVEKW